MSSICVVPKTEVQTNVVQITWKRRLSHIHPFIDSAIPSSLSPGETDLYLLVMAARDLGKLSYNPECKSYEKKQGRKSEVRGPAKSDFGNSSSFKVIRAKWF